MCARPRIEAFKLQDYGFELAPSSPAREWMDAFPGRHPYRCLPLAIANSHGWDVLCPVAIEVVWNGGPAASDLMIKNLEPLPFNMPLDHFVRSNFTRGIVTFHTSFLFRTPPDWNLLVSGPHNQPKPGAYPLTAIVESDWLPYPFTMNWQMLGRGAVRFERGEPLCTVMPIPKNYLEDWDMVIHDIKDDPVLSAEHETFRAERDRFGERLKSGDPVAMKQAWQRHYFIGRHPDGTKVESHATKVRLTEPIDASGTRPLYAKDKPASELASRILAEGNAGPAATDPPAGTKPVAKLWKETSILNDLDQAQGKHNLDGRRRFAKGFLRRSKNTIDLDGSIDPSALDFIYTPGFLAPAQCKLLTDAAKALADRQHVTDIQDPYWQGRILFFGDIAQVLPEAAALMRQAQDRITERLVEFYELTAPVYADTVQLVQWRKGMFTDPHADRANPDGAPHIGPHRDFASIVYTNDDCAGGELYLSAIDMVIKPAAGTLVAFTGGWHHEHAVLKVTEGLRITMPAFHSFDVSRRDPSIYRESGSTRTFAATIAPPRSQAIAALSDL